MKLVGQRKPPDSDPGRKRRQNEDAFVCEPPLFAIADGMGGAQAGEVASALAAGALSERSGDGGGEERVDAADPGGEPARARTRVERRRRLRHGNDDDGRAGRGRAATSPSGTSATRAPTSCATTGSSS